MECVGVGSFGVRSVKGGIMGIGAFNIIEGLGLKFELGDQRNYYNFIYFC